MFMRTLILALIVVLAHAGLLKERSYYEEKFYNWMVNYDVKPKSGNHFTHMLEAFAMNDDLIETHNAMGNSTFTLGHNAYSHMTLGEWREYMRFGVIEKPEEDPKGFMGIHKGAAGDVAASVDWVKAGAVTPVKNQGQCGSCWSFSTTGALEGGMKIHSGTLESLSEENLVDCDNTSNGCNGGSMPLAFIWVEKNGGICSEAAYPYTAGTTLKPGACNTSCQKVAASTPIGYLGVNNDDNGMMSALTGQPVSVAIDASSSWFQLYRSGVLTAPCGTTLNHGVLAVGYGTENGQDYYTIKNSWGTTWGELGYIKLAKGDQYAAQGGQCGVLMAGSYPAF